MPITHMFDDLFVAAQTPWSRIYCESVLRGLGFKYVDSQVNDERTQLTLLFIREHDSARVRFVFQETFDSVDQLWLVNRPGKASAVFRNVLMDVSADAAAAWIRATLADA